jgi:hypothetical protein
MEKNGVLGINTVAEVVALKDSLELSEELKRVLN